MGDEIRITVIATGFDKSSVRPVNRFTQPRVEENRAVQRPVIHDQEEVSVSVGNGLDFTPRKIDTKDIDLPSFMRDWPQRDH
jgi:hypothetical protein